jgi:geranylgeranyl diphosphate synthase type I
MMRGKTGILYAFCCVSGAMIGLNTYNQKLPLIEDLKQFAIDCGIAFQLQDDILGVISDEKTLGKPVGSDIREGKKTTILTETFRNSTPKERELLTAVVGNKNATQKDIDDVKKLFELNGGLAYTEKIAQEYIQSSLQKLAKLPDNYYKELLSEWAEYMTTRKY